MSNIVSWYRAGMNSTNTHAELHISPTLFFKWISAANNIQEAANSRHRGWHSQFTCSFILLGCISLILPLLPPSHSHTLWPVRDGKMGMINCTEMSAENNGWNVITEWIRSVERWVRRRGKQRHWAREIQREKNNAIAFIEYIRSVSESLC